MATEVILPRVDMDMTTGRISRWYIDEGAMVEKGQPLFEIETDKAAMEIEAPSSGVLRKLVMDEQSAIPVGSTVGWICGPGEDVRGTAPAPGDQSSDVVMDRIAPPDALPVPAETELVAAERDGPVAATPLARRLAAQHQIPLTGVPGSGPRRRIQARDVEQAAKAAPEPASLPAAPAPLSVASRPSTKPATGLNRVWLRQGEGPPLVLIHGFGGELNGWRPLVATLRTSRPVLAVDLPGHGGSTALPSPSLAGLAEAVADALAAEDLSAIDLIGHSLGGAVAAEVADTAALDIRSLFLIAPAGLGPDINGSFLDGFNRATGEPGLVPWLRLLVADETVLSPAFIHATVRLREDEAVVQAQRAVARALFPDGTQSFSIRPALQRFDRPVRVVVGTEDRVIPAHHAAGLPGLVAVHRLQGVGHMPFVEDRLLLARILEHHLQRERSPS